MPSSPALVLSALDALGLLPAPQMGQALSTGAFLLPFSPPEVFFLSLSLGQPPLLPLTQPSAVSSKVTSSRKPP